RGRAGLGVLVQGGALGAVLLATMYLGASSLLGDPARPYLRVVVGMATNLAFLTVLLIARRQLLRPSGIDVAAGFGLVLTRANAGRLLRGALVLIAAGPLGDWALGAAAWAWADEWTGSLVPSIIAHAADNLSASLALILVLRA